MVKQWGLSLVSILFGLILLTACVPIPPPNAQSESPLPESPLQEPVSQPSEETIAGLVRTQMAQQLHISVDETEVISVEAVDWPDACLGVYSPEIMCATVITPGYRVILAVDGQEYEFHTNHDSSFIQLFSAPEANIGEVLITWQQAIDLCQSIEIGTEGVAFGPCMGVLLGSTLVSPEREAELDELVTTFAPFEADTPAGYIIFQGQGNAQTRESEQRMIAEWARVVHEETPYGRTPIGIGRGVTWRREGGVAGFCNELVAFATGQLHAANCNQQINEAEIAKRLMSPDELVQLYGWLDEYAAFDFIYQDGGKEGEVVTDAMKITLTFYGRGNTQADEETQQEIISFAQALFTSLDQ